MTRCRTLVPLLLVTATVAPLAVLSGCVRPPVSRPPDDVELGEVDLPTYLQDRPAIGGKWYEYTVDGHLLEPKAEAWIVDDGKGGVHGFDIVSAYDVNTGDTGVFTLDVVHREGTSWTPSTTFTSATNIKDGAPTCLVLATLEEMACRDTGWDLRFVQQSRLSVFARFAVAEPAIYLNDGVRVARFDGVEPGDLPDPAGVAGLDDDNAAFDSTEWNYAAFAPDLPQRGRALGSLGRVSEENWSIVDGNRGLVEFSVAALAADTLRFRLRRQPIDIEDFTAPVDLGDFTEVDVDVATLPVFISFAEEGLLSAPENLAGTSWPIQPPFARDYDVVVATADGAEGGPDFLLSPASAVKVLASP